MTHQQQTLTSDQRSLTDAKFSNDECKHINKTGTIIQLEAQKDQLRCTLDSLPKTNGTVTHQKVQSYLENLTSTLSAEMNDHKFN